MRKNLFALIIGICLFPSSYAAAKDSNVVIENAKEYYEFVYDKKSNGVKVLQELTNSYQCLNYRTVIPIVEFYDDKTTIDDVKMTISGYKMKFEPKYDYYSVDNIFYSDARVCYFNLPFEKRWSRSDVYFEKTVTDPRYFTSIYFSDHYSVENKRISITIPRNIKVDLKELNFGSHDITHSSKYDSRLDADIITYVVRNIPARESESNSPGPSYTEPHLLVLCKYADEPGGKITYFNTLDDQYAWYHSLTKDFVKNEAVKAKAIEITSGITNDIDKIKKIFYWMHDNIRYIAFEDGIAGFKPDKSEEVLRKKYGDCKGMAHLTKELLKSVGFDARLCWIGTNHIAYDYSTPSIAVDNHMICALIFQGKTYFLDATENYIGFNEYAERIQGRQVLIEDGEKYIYTKVPVTDYTQNGNIEKLSLTVNGTDLEGSASREWRGEEKENIFAELNSIKKDKSNEAFIKYLSENNKNYAITELGTSSLSDYDRTLTANYKVKYSNAISSFGNDLYVDLDFRKDLADFTFDLKERKHDYWFSYKVNQQLELTLSIPAGYTVTAFPPNLSIKNDNYEFTTTISEQAGKLIYSKSIIIKDPRLVKSKFEQWNKDVEKLKAFYNEQVVFTKK
ncbi:MAG: transglutaminase-like domain-containing protein [Ferruginibacter sp.]